MLTRHHFMFHRDFIEKLISHGYRDAEAKASELRTFFGG